jgi:hypothetical protein
MLRLNNLINFSLESIEEQYFDIDFSSLDVPIAVPTKAWSKCMMRHKWKKPVEEGVSPAKVTQKQARAEGKEITKVLQWIFMEAKEQQWAKWTDLGGLFPIHWIVPRIDLLEDFLHTWESTKDGQNQANVCGKKITID